MTETALPTSTAAESSRPSVWLMTAIIAALILLNFACQYPTPNVADWSYFAAYDPGTAFKADALLSKGYIPTIDFGYTHGLLPLVYARVGFAVFGHAPTAFLILTLITEMVMAWAIARIFAALRSRLSSVLIFLFGIPLAIMPAYLTLTHPLEAMLILLALADQAEGKLPRALAILTVCLFVKPSMAYVYGFLLILIILRKSWPHFAAILRAAIPAAVTFVGLAVGLAMWLGVRPVINTLIPATGAKTYAASGFGFFSKQGREFWINSNPAYYIFTPAGFFLVAAVAIIVGAVWGLPSVFKGREKSRRGQVLVTIAVLHTTFILAFYGWTGSWRYYSYLPVLGLVVLFDLVPLKVVVRRAVAGVLIGGAVLGSTQAAGMAYFDWKFKDHATNGLRVYTDQWREWHEMLEAAGPTAEDPHPRTLVMTVGWIENLPADMEMMDAWFPETGIPTASEIARVKKQAEGADYIIVWNQYGPLDLFNSPEFASVREEFEPALVGNYFTLMERKEEEPATTQGN